MNEFQKQVDLISNRISTLSHANPPPYIHCSKINCFLLQIKEVSSKVLSTVKIDTTNKKMTNTKRTNFSNLMSILEQFQQLHSQCCGDLCAQFALTSSMRNVRTEISTIRKDCIKYLDNIGLQKASTYLFLDDSELDSQDKVDIKRIAVILNHLQMRPDLAKRDDVAGNLQNRLNSLDTLGINITSDGESDSIVFPDLPSSLNYIVKYADIEFGPLIGEGQAGKVYRGTIKTKSQDVAIKILHCRALSTYDLQMYRREIFSMSVLRHPSLVRFCGYTTEPPFCVLTEYMENGSLYDFLLDHPKDLTATDKTLIALDIARGLEFLHGRGVIHRDLKSLNILLDGRKRAKICDFGLIRMKTKDPMTGLVGTSHWMAPEVLISSPYYDEKIDIYSFGILMWEMLTAERPYENDCMDPAQQTLEIVEQNKRPLIPSNTPPNLKALIESCWQRDPKQRPSCHEIISDLSNPTFQFPGCELVLLMQEAGVRSRHNYSSSSPIQFSMGRRNSKSNNGFLTAVNLCEYRVTPKNESLTRSLRRITDALSLGHIEHFDFAITQLKSALKRSSGEIDYVTLMPQYVTIINGASPKFRTKLIQVFFDILNLPKASSHLDSTVIPKFLRSKEENIVDVTMSQLSMHPDPIFLNDETLKALFEFSANPIQAVRVKALSLLLYAADHRFDEVVSKVNFPSDILSFTSRKLPRAILAMMLKTLLKIFKQVTEISPATVQKLVKIMPTTPQKLKPVLQSCITALMKFDIIKKSKEVYRNAAEEFISYRNIFLANENEDPQPELVSALSAVSDKDDEAFKFLISLTNRFESVKLAVISFLPIRNKNTSLLASLYGNLLDFEEILKIKEFYKIANRLLEDDKHFAHVSYLLSSNSADLFLIQKFPQICETITRCVINEVHEREFLNLMFNLCCRHNFQCFTLSTSRLFANMRETTTAIVTTSTLSSSSTPSLLPSTTNSNGNNINSRSNPISVSNINDNSNSNASLSGNGKVSSNPNFNFKVISNSNSNLIANVNSNSISEFNFDQNTDLNSNENESDNANTNLNLSANKTANINSNADTKKNAKAMKKDEEVVKLSYLCLAVIAKFYTEDFDFDTLLRYAAKAVSTDSGQGQRAASFLMTTFLAEAADAREIAEIYLEFARPINGTTKHSAATATALVEFFRLERNAGKIDEKTLKILEQFSES